MKRQSVVLLSLACLIWASGQAGNSGKIAGTVRDKNTSEPLVGANVLVEGTNLGAQTDVNGDYFILNVPPGTYSVRCSFIGYAKTTQTEVRVLIDRTTPLNFELLDEAIQTEEVVIIATRPRVELDLTASKESMSRDQIASSWGTELQSVVEDIPAANINGGIRGSFGLDMSYRLDGLDLRDVGTNTNFTGVNLSTIQEVEVLTGGWNAEYGQANGSIVNIVTRKASDRLHGIVTYRTRPAGQYHWGRNFFGSDDIFQTVMTTPQFWDPQSKWSSPWMTDSLSGYDGGSAYFRAMTPQQRADWWKAFINDKNQHGQIDYAERRQWEQEVTLYGPIVEGLGFMASARYLEGVGVYPSSLKYNPDMTFQGAIDWTIRSGTRLDVTALYTKFENSGAPRTNYQSSETTAGDMVGQQLPDIRDPYSDYRYWMYGTKGGSDQFTIRPPENAQLFTMQAKLTHFFDSKTYLDVALQHNRMEYKLDYRDIARSANYPSFGLPISEYPDTTYGLPGYGQTPPSSFWTPRWGYPGDIWRSWAQTRSFSLKADLTSQITNHHLVKAGFVLSLQHFEKRVHEGGLGSNTFAQVNDIIPIHDNPYEGAFYIQDKMELGGMVVNAGVRLDFFNANKVVSSDIYDPYMLSALTPGNGGQIGKVYYREDGSGVGYVKTPTRVAISPRIGISHPITETTVLHFMFGIFNQRPAWNKIIATPVVWTNSFAWQGMNADFYLPDTTLVTYRYYGQKVGNPGLTWERMTQYEIGFEQNIVDLLSLDVTMYYKDAHDLTSLGLDQGPGSAQIQESGGNVDVRLYGDPTSADSRIPGSTIGNFTTTVNGAWADVRGIEVSLRSRLRWINFELSYILSYLSTGSYHFDKLYKEFDDGLKLGDDRYVGASNTDNGGVGLDDQSWNPHNSALLKITIVTPEIFGPETFGIYLLGDWSVSSSTRWVQGEEYTYYAPDYTGVRTPNNETWEDRWNTNVSITKGFRVLRDFRLRFFAQITNLFNNKHLRTLSGTDLSTYREQGILPYQTTTKEPAVWSWYSNLPRQIVIGTTVEF